MGQKVTQKGPSPMGQKGPSPMGQKSDPKRTVPNGAERKK